MMRFGSSEGPQGKNLGAFTAGKRRPYKSSNKARSIHMTSGRREVSQASYALQVSIRGVTNYRLRHTQRDLANRRIKEN